MINWFCFRLIFCVVMMPIITSAQGQKQEVEKKIKSAEMPQAALAMLSPYLVSASSIRYYKETDIDHESYECKFKVDDSRFSIEFDTQGRLEDIEVLVQVDDIASKAHDKIIEHLQQHLRWRFRRVQLQFSPNGMTDTQLLTEVVKNQNWEAPCYEIVVALKNEEGWSTYEILFDQSGVFSSQKLVIERQTDNILY